MILMIELRMWAKFKPSANKLVMWSIKNHWIFLIVLVGIQYLTGQELADSGFWIPFNREVVFRVHSFLGTVILIFAILLVLQKLYLWLMRTGKV